MADYTREDIEKLIDIPASVEYEIKELLDSNLRKCGIFSRTFSRRKSAASLERKFVKPEYKAGKKVQDIIGVRITLYFEDDIEICKKLLREWFRPVDNWEEYDNSIAEFRASKINGIFELNGDWIRRIGAETWSLPIDQTFEIQLRTIFFEGWHEVEHDMRYKNKDIWNNYPVFSRKLNSVVATLELCDSSMVSICEDFAHRLYLDKEWDAMIRMHYRLRLTDDSINPELKEILDANNKTLGKRLYRCRRETLISKLLAEKKHNDAGVNINQIIILANEADEEMHSEAIAQISAKYNRFRGDRKNTSTRHYQYTINPLEEYNNFFNRLTISYDELTTETCYDFLSSTIYNWARDKFKNIFKLPESITNCDEKIPGYWLLVDNDKEHFDFMMQTYHLSTSEAGQLWSVYAHAYLDTDKSKFIFETKSTILSTTIVSIDQRIMNYNPPRFYSEIVKNDELTVSDITKLSKICSPIKESDIDTVINLIKSTRRETPVVIIASKTLENGYYDEESWLSRYWCSDLAERTGIYAHIYRCNKAIISTILKAFNIKSDVLPGVFLFNTSFINSAGEIVTDKCHIYSDTYVRECVHNSVKTTVEGLNVKTQVGERAFLQEIVDVIRIDNINKQN